MKHLKIFVLLMVFSISTFAQQKISPEEIKAKQAKDISKKTGIDEDRSKAVAEIQYAYKLNLRAVEADSGLNTLAKRERIDKLIVEKNSRLSSILSSEELNKLLPGSERRTTDPAFAKEFDAHQASLKKEAQMSKPSNRVIKPVKLTPEMLDLSYTRQINHVKSDKKLSEEAKRLKIEQLTRDKNAKQALYQKEKSSLQTQPQH